MVLAVGLLFSGWAYATAVVPDYGREKKWADEIVPGLVVGDPVYLETDRRNHKFLALFTPVADATTAAIVVHGMGIHPDWGMVGTLRTALADRGITTLSIQMPVLAADAKSDAYPPLFPEAAERIAAAVDFLKAKGYMRIALVSHSMGSRMSNVYLTGKPDPSVKAWASLGLSQGDYQTLKVPVMDLYGANDLPPVLENAAKRKQALAGSASRQVVIPQADHFYTGHESEMVNMVAIFLADTLKK
ncbi:MAG: DUF3530 family protein [Thiobacillus sp.]|nr:DUF3530 family protein [Thiobacillus sp.]